MNNNKLKLFSMFSGYGGAEFALQKAGIEFETVGYSEIDKYAIECYKQNHFTDARFRGGIQLPPASCNSLKQDIYNYGDATKINEKELPDFDLLTGGFPCQSFSVAGKGKGELDARGTLFWDILRIAKEKMPKYMLLENVKGLTSKTHKKTFDKILHDLDEIGYDVDWQVLNSKEYGIPQNRQRVWFVCRRKDLKQEFQWPEKVELDIFLKDILEDKVDEKYYLKQSQFDKLITTPETSYCIDANYAKGTNQEQYLKKKRRQIVQVGMIQQTCTKRSHDTPKEINQFLKDNKGSFTLREISEKLGMSKTRVEHYFRTDKSRAIPSPLDWVMLKTLLKFEDKFDKLVIETHEKEVTFESTRRVYSDEGCSPCISSTNADKIIQVNNPKHSNDRVYDPKGIAPTLNTMQGGNRQPFIKEEMRIRKLTPKECFRLMGFLEDNIKLEGISNSQQYKLAGNGWEINVVNKLLSNLIK